MAIKKTLILLVLAIVAAAAVGWCLHAYPHTVMQSSQKNITIGAAAVAVDVADTEPLREQGLSGRFGLSEGQGMLFVFDTDGTWGIWMKDMQFPIDILWADASGRVVTVASAVAPDTYPQAFYPTAPARYVVELPSGFAARHGIAEGTKIVI